MPSGLDMGSVVIVHGVLDPACSEGKFLIVLEILVSGAIGTDENTSLGVTCECQQAIQELIVMNSVPMYYFRKQASLARDSSVASSDTYQHLLKVVLHKIS